MAQDKNRVVSSGRYENQNELPQTHAIKTRENVYATSVYSHSKSEVVGGYDVIAELLSGCSRVGLLLMLNGVNLLDDTTLLLKLNYIDWERAWLLNVALQMK